MNEDAGESTGASWVVRPEARAGVFSGQPVMTATPEVREIDHA